MLSVTNRLFIVSVTNRLFMLSVNNRLFMLSDSNLYDECHYAEFRGTMFFSGSCKAKVDITLIWKLWYKRFNRNLVQVGCS